MPKGSTVVDFAYAVHTDLGDKTVGAKVNGRHVPLRTQLNNGDMVEILKSKAQEPQPTWLNFVTTERRVRQSVAMSGTANATSWSPSAASSTEEIAERMPAKIGKKALDAAVDTAEARK